MKVLISNDDGVHAPGLHILADAMKTVADVDVVAPDRNRSGASNSLTLQSPVRLRQLDNGYYSVEGTPTDCVHIALTGLVKNTPDMVITGINAGSNLGDDVLYSGTVAAAMEGRFLGLPAIAMSLVGEKDEHFEAAAKVALELTQRIWKLQLPAATLLNVNVPDVPYEQLKGMEVTRLGTRHCAEPTIRQTDPRGHDVYWVGPPGLEEDAGPGTDFYAIKNGIVSITPIRLDLTHYESIEKVSTWAEKLKL